MCSSTSLILLVILVVHTSLQGIVDNETHEQSAACPATSMLSHHGLQSSRRRLIWSCLILAQLALVVVAQQVEPVAGLDGPHRIQKTVQEVEEAIQETVDDDATVESSTLALPSSNDGEALYKRAQRLLAYVDLHSDVNPPQSSLHPTASLFALSSYTPALDRWAANVSPQNTIVSFLLSRLRPSHDSSDPLATPGKERERPQLHVLLYRLLTHVSRTLIKLLKKRIPGVGIGNTHGPGFKSLGQPEAQDVTARAASLLQRAVDEHGLSSAALALADLHLWGGRVPGTLPRNVTAAFSLYQTVADQTGDAVAQGALAFLYASGYTGNIREGNDTHQAMAHLYSTFAALGGDHGSEMMAGYRRWAGIGTKQSCADALPFYKAAADDAMQVFRSGPPGGLHLTPAKTRLSDRDGGVYGPGASVVSTGSGARQHASHHHPTTVQEWEDVLEYYQFHAERGDAAFMFRLGRIYYQGFGTAADFNPSEFALHGGRDFPRALRWFNRLARAVWPKDPEPPTASTPGRKAVPATSPPSRFTYDAALDMKFKVDDPAGPAAGLATGYLGKMYLRGEGVPKNYAKAFLWFNRGVTQGDRESYNGLGLMYSEGLGVNQDLEKAVTYYTTAAQYDLPDAQINLGKFHMGIDDTAAAANYFEAAIKHGDQFQGYYYLAEINAVQENRPDLCPIAVAFYKRVAERGDWHRDLFWRAEKAYAEGDAETAILGFWILAEQGYEVAQNNVAYMLDRNKRRFSLPKEHTVAAIGDRLALAHWTRSAAQDNIDALVKMGDYYLAGLGQTGSIPQPEKAAACYQTASNTHVSAMAMWNLGWMHENGVGVSKDAHLAKRYYDLAADTNPEAYFPVMLSILKLYARTLWVAAIEGDTRALSLFTTPANDDFAETGWWNLRRLRSILTNRWLGANGPEVRGTDDLAGTGDNAQANHRQEQQQTMQNGQDVRDATTQDATLRALQQDDDPVEWARNARERDRVMGEGDEDEDLFQFDDGGDDFMETAGILLLCLGAAVFVFFRQQREQANARAEANRQAGQNVPPPQPAPVPPLSSSSSTSPKPPTTTTPLPALEPTPPSPDNSSISLTSPERELMHDRDEPSDKEFETDTGQT